MITYLAACFLMQVHIADPDVWGSCVATDLFRQYSSICNHNTQEDCKRDPVECVFVPEYEAEVRPCVVCLSNKPTCCLDKSTDRHDAMQYRTGSGCRPGLNYWQHSEWLGQHVLLLFGPQSVCAGPCMAAGGSQPFELQ